MAERDPRGFYAQASVSREDGLAVLHLAGELDVASLQAARHRADELVQEQPDRVVVDLTALTFMDSSGVALLLWLARRIPRVELRNPSETIRQLIDMTGLNDTLPITPS